MRAIVFALTVAASSASAAVVDSTVTGDSFYIGAGWTVRQNSVPDYQSPAMPFLLDLDAKITSIDLALTAQVGSAVTVRILENDISLPSSTAVASAQGPATGETAIPMSQEPGEPYSFTRFVLPETYLQAVKVYWVQVDCVGECDMVWWAGDSTLRGGAMLTDSGEWMYLDSQRAGYRLNGEFIDLPPVPEPGTWAMLGAGLVMLAAFAKQRHQNHGSNARGSVRTI